MTFKLDIDITLKPSEKAMTNALFKMLITGLNKKLKKLTPLIRADLALEIPGLFTNPHFDLQGVYNGLIAGPLNLEFGFPEGGEATIVGPILQQIGKSIVVEYKPMRKFGDGVAKSSGFTVSILKSDFSDLLELSTAEIRNISSNPRAAKTLPWLDWMLTQGDSIIIAQHSIKFEDNPNSRSGGAIMVKNSGFAWKVPLFAQGTVNDNWLVNTLLEAQSFVEGLFLGIVERHISTIF